MNLQSSITIIPKIGPSLLKKFEKLEIYTLKDLLYHFPFRFEDSSTPIQISDLINYVNEVVTVRGKILSTNTFRTKYGKVLVQVKIYDPTGTIEAVWFNQPYVTNYLKKDVEALFFGKITLKGKKFVFSSPQYELISETGPKILGKISGIYPETAGLSSKVIRDKIIYIISKLKYKDPDFSEEDFIEILDPLPANIREKYNLEDIITALTYIHIPKSFEDIEKAYNRLAFDEILEIQKEVLKAKKQRQQFKANTINFEDKLLTKFIELGNFPPTNAQIRCVNEIIGDLTKDTPMNRLLEGDVGSGKTWVAAASALQVLNSGYNVAFLAPTSVLATQHSQNLVTMLEPYGIHVKLVTSDTKKKSPSIPNMFRDTKIKEVSKKIFDATLYIGTHALLYNKEVRDKLGLVIVDEQHRFGVKQREFLLELESENVKTGERTTPHFLSMTATPIPRSMALTVFGDLDLSVIDELPKGRIKIDTFLVNEEKRLSFYDWAKEQLNPPQDLFSSDEKIKNQMFVICPLIEQSDKMEAKSAVTEFEKIKQAFLGFDVELLHGRMKEKEKSDILQRFRNKEFNILVATPVIEVGIDIKDATIIMIESSERFGLAQLHQLRGRVGRSNKKSYCVLFSSDGNFSDRLKFFSQTDLGIELAEYDLGSRGPGEVYGTRQSGIPKLKIANIMDVDLVKKVRNAISDLENI